MYEVKKTQRIVLEEGDILNIIREEIRDDPNRLGEYLSDNYSEVDSIKWNEDSEVTEIIVEISLD